ncbi:meiotically up-regulated gene 113-domain-containing protein [Talaromyces proteolyticus]|uniref:Meiotically up-regulated gene 113-domain-containing protein n=1 Tax=Talaromyces proteolyticus TaxID=1131652 RepID=A0AAD4Q1K4_9EURO|nr:meiotically up-regulated gene 113-domain-containing protein [Talaromyces proteolyticus]KAH8702364.1 meiotically up-regulated gene 113-domain-containing protein [Talaromyces proteolyticus]
MPHFTNTPESILPRSDSRNPASTCRGITVNGKPCRRSLAVSARSASSGGVVAMVKSGGTKQPDTAAFYCWQHKNQAPHSTSSLPRKRQADIVPISERTSIDALVERMGILNVGEDQQNQRTHIQPCPKPQENRYEKGNRHTTTPARQKEASICCFRVMDTSESLPPSRQVPASRNSGREKLSTVPRPPMTPQRPVFIRGTDSAGSYIVQQRPIPSSSERWPSSSSQPSSRHSLSPYQTPTKSGNSSTPTRPSLPGTPLSPSPHLQPLFSLIPSHLNPQTAALLLTELAKPISDADEDGYIYIFWVTPQSSNAVGQRQSRDIASNLLPPPDRRMHGRRTSDALRAAQSVNPRWRGSNSQPGTIRLKIGRTSNVHRRLNEWSKQCSHDLTLIRYYPHAVSSSSPSPAGTPGSSHSAEHGRRVPHVHRIERLIHIELADQRVRGQGRCTECGKEHREWFEFEATKDALGLVDECVRRWVSWGHQH